MDSFVRLTKYLKTHNYNSNLAGQGYNRCGCTQKCQTKKCKFKI